MDASTNDLQARYEALEAEKATLNPDNSDDRFRLSVLENGMQQLQAQMSEAGRLQRQADEVAGVELPYDYNELWGVTVANDEIRNLIQQTKEFLFSQHNNELAAALAAQADSFHQQAESFRQQIEAANQETAAMAVQLKQANADRLQALDAQRDAESKRDNAVQQAEEATTERDAAKTQADNYKAQIDELEAQLTAHRGKKPAGIGGSLKLTSTLAPETDEERTVRMKRESLEQLNRQLQSRGVAPVPVPRQYSPAVAESIQAVEQFQTSAATQQALLDTLHDSMEGQPVDGAILGAETPTRVEFEALKKEIAGKFLLLNEAIAVLNERTGGPITEDELKAAI